MFFSTSTANQKPDFVLCGRVEIDENRTWQARAGLLFETRWFPGPTPRDSDAASEFAILSTSKQCPGNANGAGPWNARQATLA